MKSPSVLLIIFFLAGMILSDFLAAFLPHSSALAFFILSLIFATASIFLRHTGKTFMAAVCLLFIFLGAGRYVSDLAPCRDDIARLLSGERKEAVVYGTVSGHPESAGTAVNEHLEFPLSVRAVLVGGKESAAGGKILVKLFAGERGPEIGDMMIIGGKLSACRPARNPAGFDQKRYMDRKNIRGILVSGEMDHYFKVGEAKGPLVAVQRLAMTLRDKAKIVSGIYLKDEETRGVVESVVLGLRSELDAESKDSFVKTGTMHIIAISGLHTALVAFAIMRVFSFLRLPKNTSRILTVFLVFFYCIFAGSKPSAIRAAVMCAIFLLSGLYGREADMTASLFFSAFLITFLQPGQLFDPGFVLSYLAVMSMAVLTPLSDAMLMPAGGKRKKGQLASLKSNFLKSCSISFATWIGLAPVVAQYFRITTPSVVLANVAAIPVFFAVIILGFVLVFIGHPGALAFLAFSLAGGLTFISRAILCFLDRLSELPLAYVRVSSPGAFMILYYLVLAAAVIIFRRYKTHKMMFLVFILFAVNFFMWKEACFYGGGKTRVTFFDVGLADASLVEFAGGPTVLIDGGGRDERKGEDAGAKVLAPYLWERGIRRIDCVVLSHAHDDHAGGLVYILENFRVGMLVYPDATETPENRGFSACVLDLAREKKIKHMGISNGSVIDIPGKAKFFILNPSLPLTGDANNDSLVMKMVTKNGNSVLFCGDAGSTAMENMFAYGPFLRSDIVKIPHHGGNIGDEPVYSEFFRMAGCGYAVISKAVTRAANKNVMEALKRSNSSIFITESFGAVIAEEVNSGWKVRGFVKRRQGDL